MRFEFVGRVIEGRGPSPYYDVAVPSVSSDIHDVADSYAWGAIRVEAIVGGITFTTTLFPKDSRYLLPLRHAVRKPLASPSTTSSGRTCACACRGADGESAGLRQETQSLIGSNPVSGMSGCSAGAAPPAEGARIGAGAITAMSVCQSRSYGWRSHPRRRCGRPS
jgi:hypothetical protein